MAKTVRVPTARDIGTVGTIESHLRKVFPEKSIYLRNPDGTNARSDQKVDTFRKAWARHQNTTPDAFKAKAAGNEIVTIRPTVSVATHKRNCATALGIPPAAIVIVQPGGERVQEEIQLNTLRTYWH